MKHFLASGQRNGIKLKSKTLRKILLSGKLNTKMNPPKVFRVFGAARYHRLYR